MKTAEEICKPFGEDVRLEWGEVADLIRAAQIDALEAAMRIADALIYDDEARSGTASPICYVASVSQRIELLKINGDEKLAGCRCCARARQP